MDRGCGTFLCGGNLFIVQVVSIALEKAEDFRPDSEGSFPICNFYNEGNGHAYPSQVIH